MKKILSFLLLLLLPMTLFGCVKEVDTTELEAKLLEVKTEINAVEKTELTKEQSDQIEISDKYYLNEEIYNEAKDAINNAEEVIKKPNQNELQQEIDIIDAILKKIKAERFQGKKPKELEGTTDELKEELARIENVLASIKRVEKETEAVVGTKFLTYAEYDESMAKFGNYKNKANELIKKGSTNKDEILKELNALGRFITEINEKARDGKAQPGGEVFNDIYGVDFSSLDLGGKTIKFFTHVQTEDDPFSSSYSNDDKDQYAKFLTELQEKYNFKIEFEMYPGGSYEGLTEGLSKHLKANPDNAAIVRTAETAMLISNIKARNFHPIDGVINSFKELKGDKAFMNDWQIEKARVFGKSFGVQRYTGETHPEMFLFNRELLKDVGISDDDMPDKLWESGKWNLDAMLKIVKTFNEHSTNKEIIPLGLSPYYLGINVVNANGIKLISTDETKSIEERININKTEVTDILSKYKELYDNGAIYYYSEDKGAKEAVLNGEPMKANHMRDGFSNKKIAMAAMQSWQVGIKDLNDYGIVPFPQIGQQDNKKYITPIDAGDMLSVTRGKNHNEVAAIMLLINEWKTNKYIEKLDLHKEIHELENATLGEVLADLFVNESINVQAEDKRELSKKVATFVQGYNKEYPNNEISIMAQIGADLIYSLALQKGCKDNFNFATYLNEIINEITSEYKELYNIVKAY